MKFHTILGTMYTKPVIFITLLIGGALLFALGSPAEVRAPAGVTVVQYWEHWSGREAEAMQGIVDDFNNGVGKEKHIYVAFLSQSNINQKTLLAASAGVPPDIAGLWDQPLPQWAALDALEPLDELAAAHGIGEGYYKPVYWKGCHYDGKLVALLSTPNDVALLWNKRLFLEHGDALRAAGLDPGRAPRTLEELDRYAAALHQIDEKGRLMAAGYLPLEPGWYTVQTPIWFGASLYDEQSGHFTLNTPQMLNALRWVASYAHTLSPHALDDFHSALGDYDTAGNPFLTGQLAMEQQGPWVQTVIEEFKPAMNRWHLAEGVTLPTSAVERAAQSEWAAAPFPSVATQGASTDDQRIDQAVTWCGFDALVIPRGAKHKNEAFEFIAYVNRMDVMEKLCALHCKGTPLAKHSDTWYATHPNPYVELFDRLALSPHAFTVPQVAIWPEAVDAIQAALRRVSRLEETPEAAAVELQADLETKLEQFRLRH